MTCATPRSVGSSIIAAREMVGASFPQRVGLEGGSDVLKKDVTRPRLAKDGGLDTGRDFHWTS